MKTVRLILLIAAATLAHANEALDILEPASLPAMPITAASSV